MRLLLMGLLIPVWMSFAGPAAGQPPPSLELGDRVRLTMAPRSPRMIGTITALSDSQVGVRFADTMTERRIAWSGLAVVERSEGRHSHVLAGMLFGLVGGTMLGAVTASSDRSLASLDGDVNRAFLFMAGGLVLGGAAGARARSDRWRRVPIEAR